MLKIRLARIGRKNDPTFRVVVTEHTRGPKSGKHLEILGNYNPKMDNIKIDGDRVKHWISNGAQVSDTVHNILVGQGIIEGKKINVLPKKHPISSADEIASGDVVKATADTDTPTETPSEETPAETGETEAPAEEAKAKSADEVLAAGSEETPAEEAPVEEKPVEEPREEEPKEAEGETADVEKKEA